MFLVDLESDIDRLLPGMAAPVSGVRRGVLRALRLSLGSAGCPVHLREGLARLLWHFARSAK
jgi:hypothetical protein